MSFFNNIIKFVKFVIVSTIFVIGSMYIASWSLNVWIKAGLVFTYFMLIKKIFYQQSGQIKTSEKRGKKKKKSSKRKIVDSVSESSTLEIATKAFLANKVLQRPEVKAPDGVKITSIKPTNKIARINWRVNFEWVDGTIGNTTTPNVIKSSFTIKKSISSNTSKINTGGKRFTINWVSF